RSATGRGRGTSPDVSLRLADGPGKAHRWQTTDTRGRSSSGPSRQAASSWRSSPLRECGRLSLDEALRLTALVALHHRDRGQRYGLRWLTRYFAERPA